jgi:hypothetical protein
MTRLILFCLAVGLALPCAAEEPMPFHFYKDVPPVASEDESDSPIVAAILDSQVYFTAREGFPDLRVFDAQGAEVPFLLEKATASRHRTVRSTCPSEVVSLDEKDDVSIEVHFRLDKKARAAAGLTLSTPLKDFERRIIVQGSVDGDDWQPLVSDGLVFDYSRYMDVSSREISLPKNRYRQFKITIQDVTDEQQSSLTRLTRRISDGRETDRTETTTVRRRPFRMNRIEFWSEQGVKQYKGDRKSEYPLVEFERTDDVKKKKQTLITLTTQREPLTSFTLETISRNFSRQAIVEVPVERGVRTDWVEIGRATLSVIDIGAFNREHLKIAFPERRHKQYRIVIDNQDNPPLEITNVKAEGNVYRMVFFGPETETCRVYYGSEIAERPNYDTAAVLVRSGKAHLAAEAKLGAEIANPAFGDPPGLAFRKLLGNRVFLGAAICIVVIVLTWILFRAGRRIDQITGDEL